MLSNRRLTVDITEEQAIRLQKHLEHGMRKLLFSLIIDNLLDLFDKYGAPVVIGALTERAISLKEICKVKLDGNNR